MANSVIAVTSVTVSPGVRQNVVRWTSTIGAGGCLPYLLIDKFQIYAADVNNLASANLVGEVMDIQFVHPGLTVGESRWYWVRPRDVSGNLGDFYPPDVTGGIPGTPTSTGVNSVGTSELGPGAVQPDNVDDEAIQNQHYANGSQSETMSLVQPGAIAIAANGTSAALVTVPLVCRGGINIVHWQGFVETLANNANAYGGAAIILYRNDTEVKRHVGYVDDDFDQKVSISRTYMDPISPGNSTVTYSLKAQRFPGQGWFGAGLQGSAVLYANDCSLICTNLSKG